MRCTNVFLKLLILPAGIKITKSTSNFFRFLTYPSKFILLFKTKIKMFFFFNITIIFVSDEYNFFILICLWKTLPKALRTVGNWALLLNQQHLFKLMCKRNIGLDKGKKTLLSVWQGMAIMGHGSNKKCMFDETCHWKNGDKAIGNGQV